MKRIVFPNPPVRYVRDDEASFRTAVARALNQAFGTDKLSAAPSITLELEQVGDQGTATARVANPGKNWLGFVRTKSLEGPGDFDATDPEDGSWATDSTSPFSLTVTLEPKHGAIVAFAAPWKDDSGVLSWVIAEHRFDADHDAELTGHSMAFDTNGVPILSLTGDEDVAVHYVTVAIGDDVAGATPADPDGSGDDGVLSARQGRIRFDGTGGNADKTTLMGKLVGYKVLCENSAGDTNALVFGPYFRRRGDTKRIKPVIQVLGIRSGDTVTITLTISDPTLAITAVEFRKKDSGGSLGGSFVSTWDSTTGTAGTNTDLARSEDVASAPGLDARFIWRVTWTDENGNTQYIGDEIDVTHLEQVSKTLIIPHAQFRPQSHTDTYGTSGYFASGTAGSTTLGVAPLVVPRGVALTSIDAITYRDQAADATVVALGRLDDTGAGGLLATLTHTATAGTWETVTSALSEDAGETSLYHYELTCSLQPDAGSAANACRVRRVEIDYNAPSYDKTY